MSKITKLSLFLFSLYLSQSLIAQSVNSDIIESSKWEWSLQLGAGISNERKELSKYQTSEEKSWYVPRTAASFGGNISRKIGKHFRLSSGVSYDYYSIKSEEFFVSHFTGHYYTSTGIQPIITTDDEPSVRQRHRGYISVPLIFEYYGNGIWAPYFKLGTTFSFNVYDRRKTVFAGTRKESSSSSTSIGAYSTSLLFGTFAGGVQYKKDHRTFTLCLTGNVGLTTFYQYEDFFYFPLPNSLKLEVGIRQEIGGKRR